MIIEKLIDYAAAATDAEGERILADPAFPSLQEVNYLVTIDLEGNCLGIAKTGSEIKEGHKLVWKPKKYRIPGVGDRASEKQAGLLCDFTSYIFGAGPWSRKKKRDGTIEDSTARHAAHLRTFRQVLRTTRRAVRDDEALRAATLFCFRHRSSFSSLLKNLNLWTDKDGKAKFGPADRFAFTMNTCNGRPAFERPALQAYWRKLRLDRAARKAVDKAAVRCLACGRLRAPVANHERPIKGVPAKKPRPVKLVSFDKDAFCSHGLKQSVNAGMCQVCVDAYTLGLNYLLEKGRPTNYIDNDAKIAYAFWSRQPVEFDLNATYVQADSDAVKRLYESLHRPSQREAISENETNEFYVLALAASGARAVVRDWIETNLPKVQRGIVQWFQDLTVAIDRLWPNHKEPRASPPSRFGEFPLGAICRSVGRKVDFGWEVPPDVSSRLFEAGLTGGPLPSSVLAAALRRVRADHDIPPPRAGLIRLVLNRLVRSRNQGEPEMPEMIDPKKPEIAYVCGRLLAVLERIQRRALGDLNATVIDRYFGAASTSPRTILPRLVAKAQNHLGKLRGERPDIAENLQKDLEGVISRIGDRDLWFGDLPQWLDMEGQGGFAIGFYHQRADYRARAIKLTPPDPGSQPESLENPKH